MIKVWFLEHMLRTAPLRYYAKMQQISQFQSHLCLAQIWKKDDPFKNWKQFTSQALDPWYLHNLKQLKMLLALMSKKKKKKKKISFEKIIENWVLNYLFEMRFAKHFKSWFTVTVSGCPCMNNTVAIHFYVSRLYAGSSTSSFRGCNRPKILD